MEVLVQSVFALAGIAIAAASIVAAVKASGAKREIENGMTATLGRIEDRLIDQDRRLGRVEDRLSLNSSGQVVPYSAAIPDSVSPRADRTRARTGARA